MMQQAIDRSTQTGGSFAASALVHALLLLLLSLVAGRAAIDHFAQNELTHIKYIEARYGEDVAEKVKLKDVAPRKPAPAPTGPGITTDSAMKRPQAATNDPQPTPRPQPTPEPVKPQLQQQLAPPPRPVAPQPAAERPQLASAAAPAIAPAATTVPRELAPAATLESRAAPAPARQVVDTAALERSMTGQAPALREATPRPAAAPAVREAFQPRQTGLQDRGGRAPVGDGPVVAAAESGRPRAGQVAEASANLGGGTLSARTPSAGPTASAGMAPPGTARGAAGQPAGILDAGPPAQGSGQPSGGRKTVLDYGTGGGGTSGGLTDRRGRLADPPATRDIVAAAAPPAARAEPAIGVAEAKLDGAQGVGMTISGQIAGRKILHSVPPSYTERARREGWEGVVAVRFTVLPDGRVKDNVYLEQTSVHRDLNQAALAAIREFRFAPLAADQGAVEQWGVITIVFRLN